MVQFEGIRRRLSKTELEATHLGFWDPNASVSTKLKRRVGGAYCAQVERRRELIS